MNLKPGEMRFYVSQRAKRRKRHLGVDTECIQIELSKNFPVEKERRS